MADPLAFDPVERAGELWRKHWPEEDESVYASMLAVTSIMRAQQILLGELDSKLRRFGLTFSRFEALVLLSFASAGSLPLSKIGERLQVHATSVTNLIDRLEAADLVRRQPNPRDGRGTLAVITDQGRSVVEEATRVLNESRFALADLPDRDLELLFGALRRLRFEAGDFVEDPRSGVRPGGEHPSGPRRLDPS